MSAPPSDERLELAGTPSAPAARAAQSDSLDLLPEVTRTFHDPAALTRPRNTVGVADETPRKRRRSSTSTSGLRRDPDWERHLRAIAIWPMFSGAVLLAVMFVGTLMLLVGETPLQALIAFVLAVTAASAVHVAYGYFLWCYGTTARILHLLFSGAVTALGIIALIKVPGIPAKLLTLLELAWPAAIFAVLMDPRAATICTEPYRKLVRRTPSVSVAWWSSPFFYLPIVLAAFAAIMIVAMIGSVGLMMR